MLRTYLQEESIVSLTENTYVLVVGGYVPSGSTDQIPIKAVWAACCPYSGEVIAHGDWKLAWQAFLNDSRELVTIQVPGHLTGSLLSDPLAVKALLMEQDVDRLARVFVRCLRGALTEDQLSAVVIRNRTLGPEQCASHDHCDANVVMASAFKEVFGRDCGLSDERAAGPFTDLAARRDVDIWSLAWARAKDGDFDRARMRSGELLPINGQFGPVSHGGRQDANQSAGQLSRGKRYLYDCTLLASVRVRAASRKEAKDLIRQTLDGASCNAGAWPDGSPVIFEASLEGDVDLLEENELEDIS